MKTLFVAEGPVHVLEQKGSVQTGCYHFCLLQMGLLGISMTGEVGRVQAIAVLIKCAVGIFLFQCPGFLIAHIVKYLKDLHALLGGYLL